MEEYKSLGEPTTKRKLCCTDAELPENQVSPGTSSEYKCGIGEKKRLKSLQLQEYLRLSTDGSQGSEISLSFDGFIRDETPICGDSEQSKSMVNSSPTSTKKRSPTPRRTILASMAKVPSAEELEEFFAATETSVRKGFVEKYNYDIVKDIPLEGRYQWVRLHPQK